MKTINLKNEIYWVKIVEFLQQNWAIIEIENQKIIVYFIHDGSIIFDKIVFKSILEAEIALKRNGFRLYLDTNENFTEFLTPPKMPFGESIRPIYSSGQFWK